MRKLQKNEIGNKSGKTAKESGSPSFYLRKEKKNKHEKS